MINGREADQESYYLGQILIYFHAVYQHSILLGTLESYEKIEDFIKVIPFLCLLIVLLNGLHVHEHHLHFQ